MIFGRVVGSVTATRKSEAISGYKFLLIQPHRHPKGDEKLGDVLIAVDLLGAGVGEDVIVAIGRAARLAIRKEDLPFDAAVIGIVDGTQTA